MQSKPKITVLGPIVKALEFRVFAGGWSGQLLKVSVYGFEEGMRISDKIHFRFFFVFCFWKAVDSSKPAIRYSLQHYR